MRHLLPLSVLALAMACTGSASAQSCKSVLTLGAWNVQWLGNPTTGKRKPQDPQDVASYIDASGVGLLALSEISNTGRDATGQARNASLDAAFAQLNASGRQWRYRLFDKRAGARDENDQWLGVAWDETRVRAVGGPWKLPVKVDASREAEIIEQLPAPRPDMVVLSRWPQAMKFSAGEGLSDWVVVPVHLKSNIGGPATAAARAYEVSLILQGVQALAQQHADSDVIVLGDTNMLAASEAGAASLAQAGYSDCNDRDLSTHISFGAEGARAPFDRIFVKRGRSLTSRTCAPRTNGSGPLDFKIVRPADWQQGMTRSEFRRRLSDHMLVRAGLCVGADDD